MRRVVVHWLFTRLGYYKDKVDTAKKMERQVGLGCPTRATPTLQVLIVEEH